MVRTAFAAEDPNRVYKVLIPVSRLFMKTPAQGAATSIYATSSPQVEGVTGVYLAKSKARKSLKRSYDRAAAARLWTVSEQLTGLNAARR